MNPVFAPLNIVRPFDAARQVERSGSSRSRPDRPDYLTALRLEERHAIEGAIDSASGPAARSS
jgi:hypothetical protein